MNDASIAEELEISVNEVKRLSTSEGSKFDPAKFRFIESLAVKLPHYDTMVQHTLKRRLLAATKQYLGEFETAKKTAAEQRANISSQFPSVIAEADRLFTEGDFKALTRVYKKCCYQRRMATDNRSALIDLTQQLNNLATVDDNHSAMADLDSQLKAQEDEAVKKLTEASQQQTQTGELKSIRAMRSSFAKINALSVVEQSIKSRPVNAGPLNPENLTTKSLEEIKKLSPGFNFVS